RARNTAHVVKWGIRPRGVVGRRVVVRIPWGGGIGAVEHHSKCGEAYYAQTPGLNVVTPATPADAYSLLRSSIDDPDPVIFLEPKKLYWTKEEVPLPVEREPIGRAVVRRPGKDVTLLAYGPTVPLALEAAEAAAAENIDAQVVDLRSLVPLDDETITAAVSN